jgi:hypothetical protein
MNRIYAFVGLVVVLGFGPGGTRATAAPEPRAGRGPASPPIEIFARATALTVGPDEERLAIKITFRIEGRDQEEIALATRGQPFNPASYKLTDPTREEIPVTPVVPKDLGETRLISSVMLLPSQPLKRDVAYTLAIQPGTFVFETVDGPTTNRTRSAQAALSIAGESVSSAADYVEQRQSGRSKVELGAGTPGGVASIELVLDKSRFLNVDWMNLRLKGNADLTLNRSDRADYFNSIVGEGMLYRPIRFAGNYSELAMGGKAESDQTFDLANAGFSVKWAWFVKNKATEILGHLFVKESANVPPLVVLSYDFLSNIKDEEGASGADDDSTHRATAALRYQLLISKDLDLTGLPALGGRFDLLVDFELKGAYDSRTDKFHDQSWVSLVFERASGPDRFKPAFTFTWARGKAAPTFEQVSAFFAGFKLSF